MLHHSLEELACLGERMSLWKTEGKTPQKAESEKLGSWREFNSSLFGKDGNQRGYKFSLNPSSAVAENSIALSLKINNVFRSYLDLVQSG